MIYHNLLTHLDNSIHDYIIKKYTTFNWSKKYTILSELTNKLNTYNLTDQNICALMEYVNKNKLNIYIYSKYFKYQLAKLVKHIYYKKLLMTAEASWILKTYPDVMIEFISNTNCTLINKICCNDDNIKRSTIETYITYLIRIGCNVNIKNDIGDTPIMSLFKRNDITNVNTICIDQKCTDIDLFIKDNKGYTVYDILDQKQKKHLYYNELYLASLYTPYIKTIRYYMMFNNSYND